MEELLRRTIGEQIRLDIVAGGGLWGTFCDPNQLESALLNLAINARDAMPDGGMLTIETANAASRRALRGGPARRRRRASTSRSRVSDTGVGMSPAVQARAFDPFFTTKPIGQGTGLGLSMVYGFARQSEGHARIYSEQGQGTTVKLYLPRHGAAPPRRRRSVAEAGRSRRRGPARPCWWSRTSRRCASSSSRCCNDLGYRALEAADGPAGLQILRSPERIDLLVTDVGLPGMNGRQVADAAREHRPGLKVLFITGYAENAAMANGFLAPGMEMVTKPFAIDALATRIRDMINA